MDDINDNILSRQWKERYSRLPEEVRKKVDLEKGRCRQLKLTKKSRKYPNVGDIFDLISSDGIHLNGVVINNHFSNINGSDLLLVAIIKYGYDYRTCLQDGLSLNNLLLPPQIIGKEYWERGYFFNIDHYDKDIRIERYGFYSVGKQRIFDEYGKEMSILPALLGVFGVATIFGISMKINRELIVERII